MFEALLLTFDYQAFKRDWHARCQHYGVDPAAGANEFQIVTIKAAIARAARPAPVLLTVEAGTSAWLQRWAVKPIRRLRHAYGRSPDIDIGAIRTLLRDAGRIAHKLEPPSKPGKQVDPDAVSMTEVADIWREVLEELRADARQVKHDKPIPLRMFGRYPPQHDPEQLFELALPERT